MKKKNKFPWYFIAAIVIVATGAFLFNSKTTQHSSVDTLNAMPVSDSRQAPEFKLNKLGGGTVNISDYKGKVVILDFWATWCPPCKAEIPDFISLQKEYAAKGLQVVGIALDKADAVERYSKSAGINYPILFGTNEVTVQYGGISSIPTTFIIDKEGRIITKFVGSQERSVFESEINKLL